MRITAMTGEPIIDAALPIVDSHHHLWMLEHGRYLLDEFATDLASGHNITSTVFVECGAMYRQNGPAHLRSVGEVEFAAGQAAISAAGHSGPTRVCAGIVGAADMRLGAAVDEVLEALRLASGGRLRGIRGAAAWDQDLSINTGIRPYAPRGMLTDPDFHAGVARLNAYGLVYDAWQYFPQLSDLCCLADAVPDTTIVVNHCGGLLGVNAYANRETFGHWRAFVAEIAKRPNTVMKLGGLSPRRCGFAFDRDAPLSSHALAELWSPYIQTCIELFGTDRCMYESNFPPDNIAGTYRTVWNALKLTASGASANEKTNLFSGTATRIYRIGDE
jgi:predicted TIM-barrel fold metal-dependent hydrolase